MTTNTSTPQRRVLLIGGHGHVAQHFTKDAVAAGWTVDSVIRNPDQADEIRALGANPVVTDITTLSDSEIDDLISGHDAVVWSAGAAGKGGPEQTYAIDRDACIAVVDAVSRSKENPRFVLVSWIGSPNHGVPPSDSFFPYADAKAAADLHTMASGTRWTILGPTTLSHDPASGITTIEEGEFRKGTTVARQAVAQVALACLNEPETVGRFIRFTDGDTPISEAF